MASTRDEFHHFSTALLILGIVGIASTKPHDLADEDVDALVPQIVDLIYTRLGVSVPDELAAMFTEENRVVGII